MIRLAPRWWTGDYRMDGVDAQLAAAATRKITFKRGLVIRGRRPPPKPKAKPPGEVTVRKAIPWKPILIGGGILAALAVALAALGRRTRSNPRRGRRLADNPEVAAAAKFREDFHWGIKSRSISRRRVSPEPRTLVKLGNLESLTYSTAKGGDGFSNYVHRFSKPRPLLAMDFDNRRLHVVGGGYTVTDRGIER